MRAASAARTLETSTMIGPSADICADAVAPQGGERAARASPLPAPPRPQAMDGRVIANHTPP